MTQYTPANGNSRFDFPISQAAFEIARQFAQQQPNPTKAAQVQRNTLAVWAVNDYLQMLGVPTNLPASDSWNPIVRTCADVADLEILHLGKLECCRVSLATQSCQIPPEAWGDRIGYLAVHVDDAIATATIFGFLPQVNQEVIALNAWHPPERIFDHLHQLQHASKTTPTTRLSEWLTGQITVGWQAVESLLNPQQLSFAFRGAATVEADVAKPAVSSEQAKYITFEQHDPIALVVKLTQRDQLTVEILLQVYPLGRSSYLEPGLSLAVMESAETPLLEAQAQANDDYLQLVFQGEPGETFAVRITIVGDHYEEWFVI
ncbi:MAG TPA: DUF1822 family protein [Leptolyngbyaceae cyanobacterium M33_DOE_097]|uniref:DUF1822 family protein n=1 Tax=Oscillatoriales cyanobacterium SpSt-418 TaxID=2282169 RepID=A0A7C3PF53_9CYAN|nr:DUF1822 family protein [Leptolyngbyaceae cyanobacterium M33_DOE_097]